MMHNHVIARRYAKGLMLSIGLQDQQQVERELKGIADLFKDSLEFSRLCEDPSFSPLERRAVISEIAKRSELNPVFFKFLLLLANKGRLSLLPLIYEALVELIDAQQGRLRVKILSATPVAAMQLGEITQNLERASKKEVLAQNLIDKSLLGGMRVEVAGAVFDATLKAKLFALKSKLLHEIGQ